MQLSKLIFSLAVVALAVQAPAQARQLLQGARVHSHDLQRTYTNHSMEARGRIRRSLNL
jgi:hypothetical protein